LQRALATAAHWTLYALMIAVPLTGWIGTKDVGLFGIKPPSFYGTPVYDLVVTRWLGLDWESWEAIVDFVHKKVLGPYVLPAAVVLHVLAALHHHYIVRDRTLTRMLFGSAPP
jgi:cytochrome b561